MPKPTTSSTTVTRRRNNAEIDARISDAVYDAILEQKLPPGTRLVEAQLCKAFDITRGTLRRVLVKLAHEGVVELQPNRGATIAVHDAAEARQVFGARMIIETGSIRELARCATAHQLAELRALAAAEHASRTSGNWRDWIRLSGDFHIQLAEATGNAIVTGMLRTLVARTSLLIGLYESPTRVNCGHDEHLAILDAVEQRDAERAARLMAEHLGEYISALHLDAKPAETVDFATLFNRIDA
jgi:DNA-binding GntR family transcriptional regulator